MNVLQRAALLAAIGATAMIAGAVSFHGQAAQAALGGPVILGGDDLTDHGCNDGEVNEEGWLYMQRALENIEPNVTRSNDATIAALGSEDVEGEIICDDAGSAIYHAAAALGITVNYYNGDGSITEFFGDLASGAAQPAIIWIAGTGASNDIVDNEAAVLTANAAALPSNNASNVAKDATRREFVRASRTSGSRQAIPNHLVVNPSIGHAWPTLSLKAYSRTIARGT
jgi:hypothetical protein